MLKEKLPRVRLLEKPKTPYTSLRSGDEGQVIGYDFKENLLEVKWDNGSRTKVSVGAVVELP